ncbi:MAG: asparagine synthase B [Lachnospiraceae bacterium]|nr:asparagine synthase B [Lachnospiraceae bacterium]
MCSIIGLKGHSIDEKALLKALEKTHTRGPDANRLINTGNNLLGFNRLSIMGLTPEGMQPFVVRGNETVAESDLNKTDDNIYGSENDDIVCVCNGEIYGFRKLKDVLIEKGYKFKSDSDCEILPCLYKEYGTSMFEMLDAEFAMILYDGKTKSFVAARDPIGIRPLYYGKTKDGEFVFASEPKNLQNLTDKVMPFPPGHFFKDGEFACYRDMSLVKKVCDDDLETVTHKIHDLLVKGVEKRLDSDAPVGFLLSGGLDSSLVCGIAASLSDKPLETWAIGMDIDAIDLKYAKEVADYIHSNHHEVIISAKDVTDAVEDVIRILGTYDITTIRASIGMYLVCKAIHEQSDTRVILTGEISDEIFGYKYTDFAPSAEAFQKEAEKRIREIHMYDVLRADRCISVNSLEARVPFGDLDFVEYCMAIDPAKKINTYGKGKYLLRKAFEEDKLIPDSILWREKAAFSDAVGHSLRDDLVEMAEKRYTDQQYEEGIKKYDFATPFTKESLMYRDIFEKYYPGQAEMVKDFWMPNKEWEGCNVTDPSARVLKNYGESGK